MKLAHLAAKTKVAIQSTPDAVRSASATVVAKSKQFVDDVNTEAEAIRSGE